MADGKLEPAAKAEEGKREAAGKAEEGKRLPAAKEECKPEEEEVAMVTERVPGSFIERVQTDPTPRPRPITEPFFLSKPKLLKKMETLNYNLNKLVDLEENVLRQVAAKGHAHVVVKFTDGIKKIFPLPGYYIRRLIRLREKNLFHYRFCSLPFICKEATRNLKSFL